MTNKDKFLRDGVSARELFLEFKRYGIRHNCYLETDNFEDFMNEQVKPTLTDDEEVILRNLKSYDTIGRTESGYLIVRDRHTIPMEDDEYAYNSMYGFNHLFQFIKERRRI